MTFNISPHSCDVENRINVNIDLLKFPNNSGNCSTIYLDKDIEIGIK